MAYSPIPTLGGYCEVDFMGAGITSCGEWIDAILQLWVQCRGDVGQLIPCHGISYVVAPKVIVGVYGQARAQGERMPERQFRTLIMPELIMREHADGWYYRGPMPGDYTPRMWTIEHPMRGPFADAEEAIRDAMPTLGIRPSSEWAAVAQQMAESIGPDVGRALMVLHAATLAE